jgi:stage V sporulation protein B
MSIYRGYYQGLKNMTPTATSEVIEAGCKFFIGYVTSYAIIRFGLREYALKGTFLGKAYATKELAEAAIMPIASAGAILGISIGAAAGFLYLILRDKFKGDGITEQEILQMAYRSDTALRL